MEAEESSESSIGSDRIGSDGRKLGFEAFFLPLPSLSNFNLEVGRIPRSRMFAQAKC